MDNSVFVIDTCDSRNLYLMKALSADKYLVAEYDITREFEDGKKYIYVFAPSRIIDINIASAIKPNSIVFCLNTSKEVHDILISKGVSVRRFFEDEMLAMQNAYLTAEGALAYVILNTPVTIKKNNILVLGYGRLGKTMTKILKDIDANVYVGSDVFEERAQANVIADYVCEISSCKKHLSYFTAIINTIPAEVISKEDLVAINKECFILDLASWPGGLDHERAIGQGFNVMHALGVPGKTAPKSSGEYIRNSIMRSIITKGKL